jgi:trehalose/maltose transport system substrate-binding protein
LGISRFSIHTREAIELVRFLCRRDIEKKWALLFSEPPTIPALYEEPDVLKLNPYLTDLEPAFQDHSVVRPARIAGKNYPTVSAAYFRAVHSVLTKEKSGEMAAADLEQELIQLMKDTKANAQQRLPADPGVK